MTDDQQHHQLNNRIDKLEDTLVDGLSELTAAVKTLVQLETEHKVTRETLARYGSKLEKHDERIDKIEQKLPIYDILVRWGGRIAMIVSGTIILALLGNVITV